MLERDLLEKQDEQFIPMKVWLVVLSKHDDCIFLGAVVMNLGKETDRMNLPCEPFQGRNQQSWGRGRDSLPGVGDWWHRQWGGQRRGSHLGVG